MRQSYGEANLEIPHDGGERVGPNGTADNVVRCTDVGDPVLFREINAKHEISKDVEKVE